MCCVVVVHLLFLRRSVVLLLLLLRFCLCARFVCVCIVNCFQSSSQLNDDADVDAADVAATVGDESMRLLLLPCMQEQSRERDSGLREAKAGRQASTRRVESCRVESRPRLVSPSPSPSPRLAHSCFVSSRFVSSCCAYSFCCRGSQSSLSTLRRSVGRLSEWVVCALIVSAAAAAQHRQHRQRAA